jgi:hypothetical protein
MWRTSIPGSARSSKSGHYDLVFDLLFLIITPACTFLLS